MKLSTFNFPVLARLVATFLFLHSTRYYYNSILLQLDTIRTLIPYLPSFKLL